MSDSENNSLHLIGMAYEAALDESRWPSFLAAFASAVGGTSAVLRSDDPLAQSASYSASIGYDSAWRTAYCDHFVKVDHFNPALYQGLPGKIFSSDQHFDRAELRKSEYFNDYLRPQDKVHVLGVVLNKEGGHSLVLGTQRGKREGAFVAEEVRLMRTIVPHITRAVQVHQKLNSVTAEKDQAQGALDQMRMGVILTNRFGTPLYLNRAAEMMMSQGIGMGIFHNKLATHRPAETAQLLKMIFDASQGVNGAAVGSDMRITMPNKANHLHCVVSPVPPEMSFMMNTYAGTDCVAIFISIPGNLQLSPKRLVTLYKITPAEARLVARLAALRSVEEAADDLGISVSTVRTQLKAVFGKTGTRSQSELLMLLATGTLAHLTDE